MTRVRTILLAASCTWLLALAGCERDSASVAVPGPGPLADVAQGQRAWGGVLPCADCDAIEVQLLLERQGERRRYRLIETYHDGAMGGIDFVEAGQWQARGGLVLLEGEGGGRRFYALLPDGRLQLRTPRGRAFTNADADILQPMGGPRLP